MLNVEGFNIIEVAENMWVFEAINGITYTGTLKEVIIFAIKTYGFKIHEVELAIDAMIKNNHNAMHFGMWGSFIYGFNQNSPKKRLAS